MRNPRLMAVFILAGSLIGALALWQLSAANVPMDAATQWLEDLAARPMTPLFLFAGIVLGGLVVFPVAPVVMFAGAVHGLSAFFFALPAMMLSCVICYSLGRYAGVAPRSHGGKAERIAAFVRDRGALASVLARFVPAFPFALQSLLLGSARVPIGSYVLGSLLGAGVVTILFLIAGAAGAKALDDLHRAIQFGWIMPVVGMVAAGVLWRLGRTPPPAPEVTYDEPHLDA